MTHFILIAAVEAIVFYLWGRYHGLNNGFRYGMAENASLQVTIVKIFKEYCKEKGLDTDFKKYCEDNIRLLEEKLGKRTENPSAVIR